MSAPLSTPDEHTLREFLLGTLAPERARQVEDWLAREPSAAESFHRLAAHDLLTGVLADTSAVEPVPAAAVEQVIRSVLQALGSPNTPLLASTPPSLSPELEPSTTPWPTKLGSYRVVREIGRGGMGVVLEGDDEELQRRVAIKVMALELARDPQAKARFLREARAAAAIDHENVVPIHHVGDDGGVPFIVMPLLRGESLESRLKRQGRLPPLEVIRLGREVAAGLAAAHARRLVHRDVKPANIWLDAETGRAKVLDFGLARAADGVDGLTPHGAMPGTPAFMAPETMDGKPADARSDLFSLGATLYQCATGQPAFTGPTLLAVLRAVAGHHPAPPHQVDPAVPGPLSDLIVRLIAKEPSQRPPSARAVADELAALGEQRTVADRHPVPSFSRRGRRAIVIGAAATLLLAGVVVAVLALRRPQPSQDGRDPLKGYIDILVWPQGRETQGGMRLGARGVLPVQPKDWMRIEIKMSRPAYLYVLWLDTEGKVTPLYPWLEESWSKRRPERPLAHLWLPGEDEMAPVAGGPPGVESLLLLAREEPLPENIDLEGRFRGLTKQKAPAFRGAVWLENGATVRDEEDRGPILLGQSKQAQDLMSQLRHRLRGGVADLFSYSRTVCFSRADEGR